MGSQVSLNSASSHPDGHWVAPPVLGAEYSDQDGGEHAFIPSQRARLGDTEVTLELRRTEDDQLAMLAFSSLESLVAGCGEAQPWVAVPLERVDELMRLSGADVVLWDAALPRAFRHPASEEGYR